jgi:hypothetical protein
MIEPRISATLLACMLAGAGCGEVVPLPDAPPEPPPAYLGVWEASSGDLWDEAYGTPRFVEFGADGSGSLFTRFDPSGVLGCGLELLHTELFDGVIAMDLGYQRLYQYEATDANTLVVSDQGGRSLTLTRTTEVPANARCGDLQVAQTVTDIAVDVDGFSGLGVQSPTSFWVSTNSGGLASINPSTGTAVPAPTPSSQYVHVQAFDGGNYWAHCGCGGSTDIVRRPPDTSATQLEVVDTTALGQEISVRAATVDGTTLWLGGNARDQSGYRVLRLTGSGATHTLADSFGFTSVQSLAALDGKLWALTNGLGSSLVRIDTTTKLAAATYVMPSGADWQALAGTAGNLWVIGREPDGDARLVRFAPPQ